jgi:hypothetical protein
MNRAILMGAVISMVGTLGATAMGDQNAMPKDTQSAAHGTVGTAATVLGHRVVSVTPRWVQESNGKLTRHLTGADVRIEAEPGMTAEYLTVELRREARQGRLDGVFGVEPSTVEVTSAGDGFVFRITAPDATHAAEIVRRAHQLD